MGINKYQNYEILMAENAVLRPKNAVEPCLLKSSARREPVCLTGVPRGPYLLSFLLFRQHRKGSIELATWLVTQFIHREHAMGSLTARKVCPGKKEEKRNESRRSKSRLNAVVNGKLDLRNNTVPAICSIMALRIGAITEFTVQGTNLVNPEIIRKRQH